MTYSIQNQTSPNDFLVEFNVEPCECLALMDAVVTVARHYSSSYSLDHTSQLYDIYDDLSLALSTTLTGQLSCGQDNHMNVKQERAKHVNANIK